MRNILFLTALLFAFSSLQAQSAEENVIRLKQAAGGLAVDESGEEQVTMEAKKPGHWNFSVGTSYSFMKGYGSGMMLYTAPTYTLDLSERWSLHGGVVASRYQGLTNIMAGENQLPDSFSSFAVFASASYRMNDRLVLHGTGVKQLVSAPITPFTPYPMDDLSLGATYKLGHNLTIGASVHMRSFNGYHSSPFGAALYPSSFGW